MQPQPIHEPDQGPQETPPIPQLIMAAPPAAGVSPPPPPLPFALGPGRTHNVLQFNDLIQGVTAMKLYNKAITPMDDKFDRHANNLAIFLANMRDYALCFNWHQLITIPLANGSKRNLLTHYGQVSIDNACTHVAMYIVTQTRNVQDNNMLYYFIINLLPPSFCTKLLLHIYIYLVNGTTATSVMIKQIIILTHINSPAVAQHVREMLIKSKKKLLTLKGDVSKFNTWVHTQMDLLHSRDQEAVNLLHDLWKAYKVAPDKEFVTYIKNLKSQAEDGHAMFTMEELMMRAENKYEAHLLEEENAWGQLLDDHKKIIAMSMEIDLLKKNHQTNIMPKVTGKDKRKSTMASSFKKKDEGKKNKWAWKDKPQKQMGSRGWCPHKAQNQ